MKAAENARATPPETLEGWYAHHQVFTLDRAALPKSRDDATARVESAQQGDASNGWSVVARLIGSKSDILVIRFAASLDDISAADAAFRRTSTARALRLDYSFLSVTEAGLYNLTAELARDAVARGGSVGDEIYTAELARRVAKERENSLVRRRLYPPLPDGMPYISFYPMSKRRAPEQNWYALPLEDRSRLMQAHGRTGRKYHGRVLQIITGSVGFEQWEWGVTLFTADPLEFKRLVTDMRFDEVSASYGDFGEFFVGKLIPGATLDTLDLETI